MALSKRTRFEILKRDGFRCVYCGRNPMDVVLHVDHVKPVCEGGKNDEGNLVTSCPDCNLGKGPVPLEDKRFKLDSNEETKDRADLIRGYLESQRAVAKARQAVVDEAAQLWADRMGEPGGALVARLPTAIAINGLANVLEAIEITAAKGIRYESGQVKYFYGVLRGKRERAESGGAR